jgi:hypothetical protein
MNGLTPCLDCTLNCHFYDSPMCVGNLIMLAEELTPITLGLHVGLNHIYGANGVPPCVRGPFGAAHWSIALAADPPKEHAPPPAS